jgi:transcriptional regulator with XRE-family HTH domain
VAAAAAPPDTIAESMAPRATLVAVPGLRYWRTRRALTQKQLAETVGAAVSTMARLEAGGGARLPTVRKLADALQVDPSALMDQPPASA